MNLPESIDLTNCKLTLSYNAAPPPLPGAANQQPSYTQYENIRVWRKQSNVLRDPRPVGGVNQTGEVGGDYVMPTSWGSPYPGPGLPPVEAYYTPEQLGLSDRTEVFYIEGVNPNPYGAVTITVTLKPIESRPGTTVVMPEATKVPETYNLSDSVLATVMEVSLDTDSDNNGAIDLGWKEKSLKNKDGRPGKFVRANIRNHDNDLLVDYADLSNAATVDFVTGRFYLSSPYPLSDLRVKFTYEGASSLGTFPDEATVTTLNEYTNLRGTDMLRLWVDWTPTQTNADGTEHRRDPANYTGENNATGNYLPPNVTFAADKLFKTYASNKSGTQTLYVEGLNGGPSNVIVEVYYKDGRLLGKDEIKFTVTDLELRVNSKNDKPNTFGGWTPTFEEWMIQEDVGKVVEVNGLDLDANGMTDYKDTGITEVAVRLVPMLLTLSENDVFEDLRVKFNYPGSESSPSTENVGADTPSIRIWVAELPSKVLTRNFSNFSGYRSNLGEGENYVDYLQPGKYYRADQIMKSGANGYKVLLWVESVGDFNATLVTADLGYADPDIATPVPQPQSAAASFNALRTLSVAANQANEQSQEEDTSIDVDNSGAKIRSMVVNLIVDSNNNDGLEMPTGSPQEEAVEDSQPKYIFTNIGDANFDGTIDCMDDTWEDKDVLVPLVLKVSQIDPESEQLFLEISGTNYLRIFKANGDLFHNVGGASEHELLPEDISGGNVVLYMEGVHVGNASLRAEIRKKESPHNIIGYDEVKVQVINNLATMGFSHIKQYKDTSDICSYKDNNGNICTSCGIIENHINGAPHAQNSFCWHCAMYCVRACAAMFGQYYGGQCPQDYTSRVFAARNLFEVPETTLGHGEGMFAQYAILVPGQFPDELPAEDLYPFQTPYLESNVSAQALRIQVQKNFLNYDPVLLGTNHWGTDGYVGHVRWLIGAYYTDPAEPLVANNTLVFYVADSGDNSITTKTMGEIMQEWQSFSIWHMRLKLSLRLRTREIFQNNGWTQVPGTILNKNWNGAQYVNN